MSFSNDDALTVEGIVSHVLVWTSLSKHAKIFRKGLTLLIFESGSSSVFNEVD